MNFSENRLSKYGRFGDNEMYRTSKTGPGKGDLWHVNSQEKQLMNMYGQEGERLVDLIGSGTTNPITGKEEKFVQMALMGAQLGLSLYQGAKNTGTQRDMAKEQLSIIDEQEKALTESEIKLSESVAAQNQLITQEAGMELEKVTQGASKNLEQTTQQSDNIIAKTGFATSGDAQELKDRTTEDLRTAFDYTKKDMMSQYGKALGSVSGMYEEEKARIRSEKERLEQERKLASTQANKKFLGIF